MLSVLESAIDLGTGRELPVVGFVNDTLVLGVIVSPKETHIEGSGLMSRMRS